MPMYDYECKDCGRRFTLLKSIKDRKEPEGEPCPSCGELSVTQIITTNFEMMAPDRLGLVKPPTEWRNFINNVKRKNVESDFTTW